MAPSDAVDRPEPGRVLSVYGVLLGFLLAGYLFFDRAFAYLHLPGSPLFISELVILVGVLGVLTATGHLWVPLTSEPLLLLLVAYLAWGAARTLPGIERYGVDAFRDAALVYYAIFALLVVAVLARSPEFLDSLLSRINRTIPWLLLWLIPALLLIPMTAAAPTMPFTDVSVLSHKAGNAALAAVFVLAFMWLLPDGRTDRSRQAWSVLACVVIAIAGTQNRGGLLGAIAGAAVALAFLSEPRRLVTRILPPLLVLLTVSMLVPVQIPHTGLQGRDYSMTQLVENVSSLVRDDAPGNLRGTARGRQELWSRVLDKQVQDGLLVEGSGFGPNLAAEAGVYDEGQDTLRNPHNSHLHVIARTGLIGLGLWVALWVGWYWRLITACGRLAAQGRERRRGVAALCMTVTTTVLLSSLFDPMLEGPQVAALLWTVFGIGLAVTTSRSWYDTDGDPPPGRDPEQARGPEGSLL